MESTSPLRHTLPDISVHLPENPKKTLTFSRVPLIRPSLNLIPRNRPVQAKDLYSYFAYLEETEENTQKLSVAIEKMERRFMNTNGNHILPTFKSPKYVNIDLFIACYEIPFIFSKSNDLVSSDLFKRHTPSDIYTQTQNEDVIIYAFLMCEYECINLSNSLSPVICFKASFRFPVNISDESCDPFDKENVLRIESKRRLRNISSNIFVSNQKQTNIEGSSLYLCPNCAFELKV